MDCKFEIGMPSSDRVKFERHSVQDIIVWKAVVKKVLKEKLEKYDSESFPPAVLTGDYVLVDGYHRLIVLFRRGVETVECVRILDWVQRSSRNRRFHRPMSEVMAEYGQPSFGGIDVPDKPTRQLSLFSQSVIS